MVAMEVSNAAESFIDAIAKSVETEDNKRHVI